MKVAQLVTRSDSIGGAHTHILDLCEALRSRGHAVAVLTGGSGPFTRELARRQIRRIPIPHLVREISPVRDLLALQQIGAALKRFQPDLVAAHTAKAGFLGRLAGRLARVPVVYTPHGWCFTDRISRLQGRVYRIAEALAAPLAARVVNVCEFEVQLALLNGIASRDKLVKVHNGIADVPQPFWAKPESHPPRIVMVARMEQPKDPVTLLRALSLLKHLPWELELAGDGPLTRAVRRLAEELGLAGRVTFRGFVSDVPTVLAGSQIFALCSRFEAFPYTVVEAMRAGLPVAASNVGGISEAVIDGVTGLLSPAGDVHALARNLSQLIRNPELRRRLGEEGRRQFLSMLTLERMISDTLAVYEEVLHGRVLSAAAANSTETRAA